MKHALRQLGKSPGFTTIAILTLALGIGASTAIFSVINSALLQPLPYPESGRLVEVWRKLENGNLHNAITGPQFKELREHATSFEQIALAQELPFNLLDRGSTERINGMAVSANYLDVLRISPQLGQAFEPHADQIGGNRAVVLLTDRFWRTRFGADPTIVGQTIQLSQTPHIITGVLPPGAILRDEVEVVVPLVLEDGAWRMAADTSWAPAIGRLRPGVSLQEAEGQAEALAAAVDKRLLPDRPRVTAIRIRSMQDALLANTRPTIWLLFGAVSLVLVISCANVANLLLVRATARQREMAVRAALGASTSRIVRQVLVESTTLALLGGGVGVLFAWFAVDLVGRAIVSRLPGMMQPQIDPTVLAFSIALAGATGIVFGLLPALRARHIDLTRDLKSSGRGTSTGGRTRAQSALVVSEVALTVALLIGAGLLLRSFSRLLNAELGYNSRQALVCDLALSREAAAAPERTIELHRELIRRLSVLPGVSAMGTCTTLPLSNEAWGGRIGLAERPVAEHNSGSRSDFVGGRYFEAMGIPLLKGRYLNDGDNRLDAPRVTVVSEVLAAELWQGADPIGRRVIFGNENYEVVGIVRSIRHRQMEDNPGRHIYLPHVLAPFEIRLVLRTQVPPLSLADDVKRVIAAIDPGQSVSNMRSLEQVVDRALHGRQVALTLVGFFAVSALGLACLGIYGVMAYTISQREREFGIRLALGASPGGLLQLVLRDGLRLVLLGVAAGLLIALGASRLIASLVFGVSTHDPLVFIVTPLVLGLVALAACWLPARRATRVDPIIALRAE